jgi:ATPase subunit of ABC transporter with duplicated ATPase domains
MNGAGKSTFLRCLAKKDTADKGIIETASNTNVVYVDQEPDWGNRLVYEALFGGDSPQAIAVRMYMKATGPFATGDDNELADALDRMEVRSCYITLVLLHSMSINCMHLSRELRHGNIKYLG